MVKAGRLMLGIDIGGSSVKASLCGNDGKWNDATSDPFVTKDRGGIQAAIRQVLDTILTNGAEHTSNISAIGAIGLCLPGRLDRSGEYIEFSLNLPALNGWCFDEMITGLYANTDESIKVPVHVSTDAHAAGYDYATEYPIKGRTAAISLGTGVGLCVLDAQHAVGIGNKSIGHLGQLDVGMLGDQDRIDEYGTINSLESYIGLRALGHWIQGSKLDLSTLEDDDAALKALVRALRSVHAVYSPDRVVLLGGVGLAFGLLRERVDRLVCRGLTPLAVDGAELLIGKHQHHAARGAAKLAVC